GNVLPRNGATLDGVDEFETGTRLLRLDGDPKIAVLGAAAGLTDKPALLFDFLANGFLVCNLRSADISANVELAKKAVNDDLKMQLTHAGNNRLAGFFIGADFEGRIFSGELLQR